MMLTQTHLRKGLEPPPAEGRALSVHRRREKNMRALVPTLVGERLADLLRQVDVECASEAGRAWKTS